MKIRQQTIDALKEKGVNIKWYSEDTYEEFKKNQWDKEFKRWYEYSKSSCKELNPPRNDGSYESWQFETVAEYEKYIAKFCDRIIDRHCDPYEYTTLYVEHDGGKIFVKKENVKSKDITEEYVMKLVEKSRKLYAGTYGRFAIAMQQLCKERGYSGQFAVYPTTYGIGVWLFYNFRADENIADVKGLMDERGIEYYNEYSEHRWVYRFKETKKKENLEKIFIINP